MNVKSYLFNFLAEIKKEFTTFNPFYEYDEGSSTYFIHVIPQEIDNEHRFNQLCGELILDMMDKYPDEYLCFITSKSLTRLKNPQMVFPSPIQDPTIGRRQPKLIIKLPHNHITPEFSGFSFCI